MKLVKIKFNNVNGGSIRCFVTHKNNNIYDNKKNIEFYKKLIKVENKLKIKKTKIYKKFSYEMNKLKKTIKSKIQIIKKNNKTLYVLGASTKGNTILQFLDVNKKIIPYAIERNKSKIGAKTIGSNIDIISEKEAKKNKPDYKFVLPWHFKEEIIKRELNYILDNGKLLFPLPNVLIVDKKNYKSYVKKN